MDTRIMAAVDRGPAADVVVAAARDLAAPLGAGVTVVHVMTDSEFEAEREGMPPEHAGIDQIGARIVADLLDRMGLTGDDRPQTMVLLGDPSAEILHHLGEGGYDYVVVGVRNRSRVGKFLLGSVTQDVLLGSPCPVVAVPV